MDMLTLRQPMVLRALPVRLSLYSADFQHWKMSSPRRIRPPRVRGIYKWAASKTGSRKHLDCQDVYKMSMQADTEGNKMTRNFAKASIPWQNFSDPASHSSEPFQHVFFDSHSSQLRLGSFNNGLNHSIQVAVQETWNAISVLRASIQNSM